MQYHDLMQMISAADDAINRGDFDRLMDFYSDDAVLVVQPGVLAKGKVEIRKAFDAIANYFNHSLVVTQGDNVVLETGDTALVLSKTFIRANEKLNSEYSMERSATYVFKRDSVGAWHCVIDNSYGTELIDQPIV